MLQLKDHWSEQRLFARRAVAASLFALALLGFLVARLVVLQIVNHEHFQALSHGNRVRIEPVPPTRGLIYDRNGIVLAENVPAYQLVVTPEEVADLEETLERLEALLEIRPRDRERFAKQLRTHRRFDPIPLRFRLSEEEVARFAVQRPHFPGVDIRARLARHYPLGPSAVHAIGYVGGISENDLARLDAADYAGTTHTGKVGIEHAYEKQLHGTVGYRQVLVNAQGRALTVLENHPPTPGQDLYLSLDVTVQQAAERALAGRRGAVVALDSRGGGLLALASTPTFDPNAFGEGLSQDEFAALRSDPDQPLFNRALRGLYPPGSTVKPVLALAGLHYHAVSAGYSRVCPGFFRLPGHPHRYRDWKRAGHGVMDMHDAIMQSCDVYFYELALELGIDRMHEFLTAFGLGVPTGIDIRGEKAGVMPSRDWKARAFANPADRVWFPGETIIAGIGQGFMLTTPLQLAHITATLAMAGARHTPHLVSTVGDPLTGIRQDLTPTPLPPVDVADQGAWHVVLEAMDAVVNGPRGTARAIGRDAGYRIAGKTGTAQVFSVAQDEEYDAEELDERLRDHAWFIAFAPADAPEIAVAVLVENGGSGSSTAAPVARAVLDTYFGKTRVAWLAAH